MSRSSRQSRSWFWSTAGLLLISLTCAGITCQWYKSGSTLLDQGRQAYARGQWSQAGDLARRHLKNSPDDPEGLRLLARSTARLGRDRPANALFARLGKDALQAEDYFLLGQGMNHAGRGEAAVGLWEKALRADSGHADVLEQLAQAYTARNRLVEAQDLYERLARQPGWELRGELSSGGLRAELDDPAGAAKMLEQALNRTAAGSLDPVIRTRYRKLLARVHSCGPARSQRPGTS